MPDLPKRKLGRTGLNVTVLGFGALELRGMVAGVGRPLRPGQPESILNAVLDAGINYIDMDLLIEPHLLNQYQGGICISGVLKTTERTLQHLILLLGPNWVPTDNAV